MNTVNLIYGFGLMMFGYLGIEISKMEGILNIQVLVGSASWYILKLIPLIFIMIGGYKVYLYWRLKFKKHHEELKSKM